MACCVSKNFGILTPLLLLRNCTNRARTGTMLASVAEQRAETATKRRPFAVNLNDVKATVAEILSQVGRFNFFNEFTPHNIRHVDEMLTMLEWVVPDPTARLMSPADWFMVVMAAYFHDLGLLVTKDEFAQRANSDFDIFCEQTLFSGDRGQDYRLRIAELAQPQRDEFLYQEFVRANHGKRIRTWIMNVRSPELGAATAAIDLIDGLLKNLDPLARRDLATVCESHTLSDLTDFKKYPVERPYDNSVDDTANLHYCALLLRTIDLLQITKDRAPTALFRIIDPSDPVSQAEWAKQNAVKRVKAKEPKTAGEEGARESQINTIEVFANFQSENSELNENGYFALTSYLSYAAKELALAHQMAQLAAVEHGSRCQFPWRFIDTTNVEAEGFLKEQFEFSIDQSRILDLLTGHTLYNNSLVVMRELVQNSLDAVRLYDRMIREDTSTREPVYVGKISILWDSELRLLQILDNGTGMSQEVIQNHLLKVGSSRYQDDSFKKSFPDFAPISRFGIGVLTAFMIADTVEIMTSETNDPKVRQISLRSVHGKYLIRLIDKEKLRREQPFPIHGTLVRLKLRRGVHTTDLLGALRQWIVIPGCAVTFCADRGAEISIGAPDAHTAMSNALVETGWPQRTLRDRIEVRTARQDGIEFAYPVSWSETFREWQLMRTNESIERRAALPLCCTCV